MYHLNTFESYVAQRGEMGTRGVKDIIERFASMSQTFNAGPQLMYDYSSVGSLDSIRYGPGRGQVLYCVAPRDYTFDHRKRT